jgi:hypothetical protein
VPGAPGVGDLGVADVGRVDFDAGVRFCLRDGKTGRIQR